MAETFLILFAGGIMCAAAISDPDEVTLNWLRLCGIIALALAGLSSFFLFRRPEPTGGFALGTTSAVILLILAQLAFVQVAWRTTQRVMAALAFVAAVRVGASGNWTWIGYTSAVGIAAMSGLALMDMLLGHAYLTASKMTMGPFRRLNLSLAATIVYRTIFAVGVVLTLQSLHPVYMLWGYHGLFILTRWIVGLLIPAIFVYMAHDCIKRRSTQSATGILYVAGVLILIGEIIATYLMRVTGLPF